MPGAPVIFPEMRAIASVLILLVALCFRVSAAPAPESVAILYNSAVPESRELAELYQKARGIPAGNLIALKMPVTPDISRQQYEDSILMPLRAEFDRRAWWKRGRDGAGNTLPVVNKIRVMVTMRGVPLRIKQTPRPKPSVGAAAESPPAAPKNPFEGHDEASVDSELAMFGVEGVPLEGGMLNKYYKSKVSIEEARFPFLILTARIDAPNFGTCVRMIREASEVEKSGLWGMCYVDIANKFPQGDQWLETVVNENAEAGIPTVVDRFNDTFPKNYPMSDTALYFGWYDRNVNGPFLNPLFRFRKGAVAMHLHSFSAEQLRNVTKNWSGALLEKGAAVTVGNVFEPYLHLTHDLGILQKNLLAGDCWVEACWKSMPVASWQAVVLGDPLYRPFMHRDGSGARLKHDTAYRALRSAKLRWPNDFSERVKQLERAATRMKSGVIAEAVGLEYVRENSEEQAVEQFGRASEFYARPEDKVRQVFHEIAIDRQAGRKENAVRGLRGALAKYSDMPESEPLKAWLDILDPPPPPPADPTKLPAPGKTPAPAANKP